MLFSCLYHPPKIHNAQRHGLGHVFLMLFQQPHILAVDKSQFNEHGGHTGLTQDAEAGATLTPRSR